MSTECDRDPAKDSKKAYNFLFLVLNYIRHLTVILFKIRVEILEKNGI